ncbi:MAG: hypothetical protein DRJ03_15505 [Chloroflexi bacterium]|nr:MAG: hypothetical protein DRI81_07240 [Chloroflexota bacterium]RLC83993.1 MAG: hypothetical protein DRJ03_15505 [Chloroflexota bacterium]
MNNQKSLIHHFVDAYDRYRAERHAAAVEQDAHPQPPGRLRRLLRWLTPNGGTLMLITALILTQNVWARTAQSTANSPGPSATTVNYQGRLADSGGAPLDGSYGMSFALYDAATDGSIVWGPESHTAVPVSDGLFSVGLGSQTSGGIPTNVWDGDRYLEITVGGETLSPRELIRSVPIAGMALTVPDDSITMEKIVNGAVTQEKAPTLLQSANGENEIVRSGNTVFSGSDADGFIIVTYPCFPNGVRTFIAVNGHWNANHSQVIAHNGAGRCSTRIKLSPATSNSIRINWIAIGN